jgi:hypothetical protein
MNNELFQTTMIWNEWTSLESRLQIKYENELEFQNSTNSMIPKTNIKYNELLFSQIKEDLQDENNNLILSS